MLNRLRQYRFPNWSIPLALLWVCVLAFGLVIPMLGLYADDWPFVYVNQLSGLRGVVDFISWVRPFGAWIFAAVTALGGTHFWFYHLLLLLLRALDAWLLWRFLRCLWPNQPRPALWAALLFAIFPAFKQQPLALEYALHFIVLALLLLSMTTMIQAARRPSLFSGLAVASWLLAFNIFFIEYFAGQEALRPVLLWLALAPHERDRRTLFKTVVLRWLPYLFVFVTFLVWRVFVLRFPSYRPELLDAFGHDPLGALSYLVQTIAGDLFTVALGTWGQTLVFPPGGKTLLLYLGLVTTSLITLLAYLFRAPIAEPETPRFTPRPALTWMAVGLVSMLVAGWPFWITNLPVELDFPWDRTTLAFMPGACLFAAGLLLLLTRPRLQNILLAILISLSIGLHFQNANRYRKETSILTPFYWQLAWRAPGLETGTALVLDREPFEYHIDKFLTPLVNWSFAPEHTGQDMPLILFDLHKVAGKYLNPDSTHRPIKSSYGTLSFKGNTANVLLIAYDPPACLRILGKHNEGQMQISKEMRPLLRYSNLEQIRLQQDPPARPPDFLGPEPPHTWCYYFEKADLALQAGAWDTVARLGDEAQNAGLRPTTAGEWFVFIEGYARAGQWQQAQAISEEVAKNKFYHPTVCRLWHTLLADAGRPDAIPVSLNCSP